MVNRTQLINNSLKEFRTEVPDYVGPATWT